MTMTTHPSLRDLARRIERSGVSRYDALRAARDLLAGDGDQIGRTEEVDRYYYVRCVYGAEGDEPGDCRALVLRDQAGVYWVEDGDDDATAERSGPYWTEAEARAKASAYADDNEAEEDEDAEAMIARLNDEARDRAVSNGHWVVLWIDPISRDEGRSYDERNDAEREIAAWYEGVYAHTPTALTHLMCHPTLGERTDDGSVVISDEE